MIVRQTVVDRAYETMVNRLTTGEFAAGDHLTETRLCTELGISRGSLRETLKRLAAEGLIDIHPNRGVTVRRVSRQSLAEFFQIRSLHESFAARRAAERIDEFGHRDRVAAMLQDIETTATSLSLDEFPRHDAAFHTLVVEMSGNQLLLRQWERLKSAGPRMRYLDVIPTAQILQSLEQHRTIMLAILDGDAAQAEQSMTVHIQNTANRTQRLPQDVFDSLFNGRSAGKRKAEASAELSSDPPR